MASMIEMNYNSNSKFHLVVFFTFGTSLKQWSEVGLIGRELLLYRKMVKDGHQVTLITYGDEDDYKYIDSADDIQIIPVYHKHMKKSNKWLNLFKSFAIPFKLHSLLSRNIIIKTNQMRGAWVPLIASLVYRKPLVVRCGYEMLRNFLRDERRIPQLLLKAGFGYLLEFLAYLFAKKIIISNVSDFKFIKRSFLFPSRKLTLIRNFIDTDLFSPAVKLESIDNEKRVLYIGRLEKRKNVINLVKAVSEINCQLDMIGNGSLQQTLEELAKNSSAKVCFLGSFNNTELPEIIRKYDAFILPSFYENNPKTILEAMSCGSVVIGTNTEGIKELIKDGQNGFLSGTTKDQLKSTLKKVLKYNSDQLELISKQAREFVLENCSIERIYQLETDIYLSFTNSESPGMRSV